MFLLDKLTISKVFTNDDILKVSNQERELVTANLFVMFKCDKYYDQMTRYMFRHVHYEEAINDIEHYAKYPLYYEKIKYIHKKLLCKKEDLMEFINEYELSISIAHNLKDVDYYNYFDIIPNDTQTQILIVIKNILNDDIKKSINIYIDDHVEIMTKSYLVNLGLLLDLPFDYLIWIIKYNFLVMLQTKKLFTDIDILKQIIKLKNEIKFNNYGNNYFESLIELKYNSLMAILFKTKIHTKRVFEHQIIYFNKTRNNCAFNDVVIIMFIMKTPKLDTLLKNNIVLLQNIQNSRLCQGIIPIISNILLALFVSDNVKEQLGTIFYNDLCIYVAKQTNKKFAIQKPNVMKRCIQDRNDKSICSICYDDLLSYAVLCLSCNKYIACLTCFNETQKYYNINCIRCRK